MDDDLKFSAYWEVKTEESINLVGDDELKGQLKEMALRGKQRYEKAIKSAHENYQSELVSLSRLAKSAKG